MGASLIERLNRPGYRASIYGRVRGIPIRVSNHTTVGGAYGPWAESRALGILVAWSEDYQPCVHIAVPGNGKLGRLVVRPSEQESIREFVAWLQDGPMACEHWMYTLMIDCPSCRVSPGESHLGDCARKKTLDITQAAK